MLKRLMRLCVAGGTDELRQVGYVSLPDLLIAAHQLDRAAEAYLAATGSPNTREALDVMEALYLLREEIRTELEDLPDLDWMDFTPPRTTN